MFENLPPLENASAMARHAAMRHRVIAENLANADTPGYRARDVKEFSTLVNEAFTARATRAGHVDSANGPGAAQLRSFEPELPMAPNGNSVSLEDQALRAVETQGQHRLATTLYGKSVELLRMGLGRLSG